jgi:hypothetical protein
MKGCKVGATTAPKLSTKRPPSYSIPSFHILSLSFTSKITY